MEVNLLGKKSPITPHPTRPREAGELYGRGQKVREIIPEAIGGNSTNNPSPDQAAPLDRVSDEALRKRVDRKEHGSPIGTVRPDSTSPDQETVLENQDTCWN